MVCLCLNIGLLKGVGADRRKKVDANMASFTFDFKKNKSFSFYFIGCIYLFPRNNTFTIIKISYGLTKI